MSELVTCIVPVHNGERFLEQALGSIQRQTHSPVEIIVVDDGSSDQSPAIAGAWAGAQYVRQEQAGPAAARNAGIRRATGAFISFLDADDLWHPEKLARQLARFAARPDLEVSVT